ncbi:MAG: energy-coupled thiamine transporter ThiT [Clostridia bacterium]|nr:energy-coupled thiamine transporter ThiT [Clostridia bacterium]
MTTTKKMTTSALMVALATVLMWVSKLLPAPWLQGGSITLASMVPIIITGILFGTKWGLLSSVTYAIIQMMFGFYPPPTQTFFYFVLVVLLDYILAFGVLGLGGIFRIKQKQTAISAALGAFFVTTLRYVCHILSGILIWGVYAEEGQSVLAYSLIYNGSYMIPEIVISTIVTWLLFQSRFLKQLLPNE